MRGLGINFTNFLFLFLVTELNFMTLCKVIAPIFGLAYKWKFDWIIYDTNWNPPFRCLCALFHICLNGDAGWYRASPWVTSLVASCAVSNLKCRILRRQMSCLLKLFSFISSRTKCYTFFFLLLNLLYVRFYQISLISFWYHMC